MVGASDKPLDEAIVPGHYIVVLEDSVDHPGAVAEDQVEDRGGELGLVYRYALKGYSAELSKQDVEVLRNDPRVKYVSPDREGALLSQTTPTGVKRVFAPNNANLDIDGKDDLRVNADVAVIDTGVDFEHPDLDVVSHKNCAIPYSWEEGFGGCIEDATGDGVGHGTHVAGIVGALDNGEGVVGVAPGARLWSMRVFSPSGFFLESWATAGIDWVTQHADEIEVANVSLGCLPPYPCVWPTVEEAIDKSVEKGIVYVVAAGNSKIDASEMSPSRDPHVITVSALADYDGKSGGEASKPACDMTDYEKALGKEQDDTLANFSNFGSAVDVAAPGLCIYSTFPTGGSKYGKDYGYLDGTSMAAPHVTGAVADLVSKGDPQVEEDVIAIRNWIAARGNSLWTDDSGDGWKEALLDVGSAGAFPAPPPTVTTNPVEYVTSTYGVLKGSIPSQGFPVHYHFDYGTTEAYGSVSYTDTAKVSGFTQNVAAGSDTLQPGTTYHFRLVGNGLGGVTYGKDETFKTLAALPTVTTKGATDLAISKATLNGTINPGGGETTYRFEYDTAEYKKGEGAHGTSVPIPSKSIGSGLSDVDVSEKIEGLKSHTFYHFRVVATNSAGTSFGEDSTFFTGTWSTQTTPNPTPRTEAKLEDVSCASASMCMAAGTDGYTGRGFGESWNGSEWKTLFTDISGFQPRGVACTSTTSCIVAGSDGSGTPKAELWQYEAFVSEWVRIAKTVPSPEGATSVKLNDVSCTSASACTAVGSYLKEGKTKTLAERYNGTSFSIQTTANPEAGSAELLGVSCASATSCFAVGKKGGETFAQSWNGTTWSISTTPNPSGAEQSILRSVSCTSASACTAVGYSVKTEISKPREALIERYNGTSWSIQTAAAPAGGVGNVEFSAVTCPSASSCVAVGEYATENVSGLYIPEASKTLIESWNGSTWSVQASPNVEGKKANLLAGVSCTATSACTAVGNARASYGSGQYVTLGERWNGSTWSTQTTPNPTPRTEAKLEDVSCASASMCMAAGTDGYTGRGFGESWNGSEWKTLFTDISGFQPRGVACTSTTSCIVAGSDGSGTPKAELWQYEAFVSEWVRIAKTVPSPEGATSVKLNDVSCTSASACTAVGSYLKEGKTKTLAERYNGTSFSIQTTANPEAGSAELLGVSCASATSCFAVGKKGGETFAQSWNGTTWSISTTPNPSGAEQSILRSVSCTSASACTAVGYSVKTEISKPREALIERYNGTSWSIQTAAAPAGGVGNVEFSAVTCPSASSCVAVGEYATENVSGLYIPEASKTLIESWNGSTWSVQASPNVEGKKANLLAGVSCTATSACTAVGNARASYGSGQYVTLGERWE